MDLVTKDELLRFISSAKPGDSVEYFKGTHASGDVCRMALGFDSLFLSQKKIVNQVTGESVDYVYRATKMSPTTVRKLNHLSIKLLRNDLRL